MLSNIQTGTNQKGTTLQRGGETSRAVNAAATASRPRSRKNSATPARNGHDGAASGVASTPTHDEIVARAFQIYVKKGRPEGRDMENWLEAEMELQRERGMRPAKKS